MWKLGFIGMGNVGQGLLRILHEKREILKERYGFEFQIQGILGRSKGSVYDEAGLDSGTVLELLGREGNFRAYPEAGDVDLQWFLTKSDIDIIIEAIPTNLETGEPGIFIIRSALKAGKHVVSCDKGPASLALGNLLETAQKNGVSYRFEGVLMSGTPSINLVRESLAGCDVLDVQGIVNGTTNYILTRMESGMSYDAALRKSQELGYAEADPTGDVEGWDAAVKAQIIANVFMDQHFSIDDVKRSGITGITPEAIEEARRRGKCIKLIARVSRENGGVTASVAPAELSLSHPLAGVSGATNAITFKTDNLQDVTIIGPGAGRVETGQSLMTDILAIHRSNPAS